MGFYADCIFPWLMDLSMRSESISAERRRVLRDVAGDVLEIGFGTGLNLPHYVVGPDGVRSLTALDPSRGMAKRAARRLRQAPLAVRLEVLPAERLPFADEQFDAAVSTWTLCSVADPAPALAGLRRVLKRGGRFFFLEHGRAQAEHLRRWQDRLNPLQRRIACGCNLNRDIEGLVSQSGLRIIELERYFLPRVPKIVGSMYRGVAVRDG
ncbi:MAG: class I SAM-dependent methyltransferase [Candidatus Tectomicrobia bacterium]|nr:class I SAM-dependent methyltransferase [Candidatus Tectomicrobia bacterium]